jgi:hypothetical protein
MTIEDLHQEFHGAFNEDPRQLNSPGPYMLLTATLSKKKRSDPHGKSI